MEQTTPHPSWDTRTTSRMLEFVFRMFSLGPIVLPERGMGSIPQQLASTLPTGTIHTETPVTGLQDGTVYLASGQRLQPRTVVIATDGAAAAQLLGEPKVPQSQKVTYLYFSAPKAPLTEPVLVLNGEGDGLVNSVCVMSAVAPTYAPPAAALVSVTVLREPACDDQELETAVRSHLSTWLGSDVHHQWRHLRTYRIPYALPQQYPPSQVGVEAIRRVHPGLVVCGDRYGTASINGAMQPGRSAAEAVITELGRRVEVRR